MLYKLLGMVVWKLGWPYVRRQYGRRLLLAAAVGAAALAGGAWLASRPAEEG